MKKNKGYGYNEMMREALRRAWEQGVTEQAELMKVITATFAELNKKA